MTQTYIDNLRKKRVETLDQIDKEYHKVDSCPRKLKDLWVRLGNIDSELGKLP